MSTIDTTQELDRILAKLNGKLDPENSASGKNSQAVSLSSENELFAENGNLPFFPRCPHTLEQAKLTNEEVLSLVLKFLLNTTNARCSTICNQIKINRSIIDPLLNQWKTDQLISIQKSGLMDDYQYVLTENGTQLAKRQSLANTYFGSAPVEFEDYLKSVARQSVTQVKPTPANIKDAFHDMSMQEELLSQIGRAVYAGSGMFLYGNPGNGKTSIAERLTRVFGDKVWIPRTLKICDEVIRLFDPSVHVECQKPMNGTSISNDEIDNRWICIERPFVAAGGELTMDQLELTKNRETGINEAPIQLKSNCGVLLIDDFGRQQMSTTELLNRWIVPLEKKYDFLNMDSGRKIQVPFDQHVVFSTNLEPSELVDEAFLRRIPYKIHVKDPAESAFRNLMKFTADKKSLNLEEDVLDHLIDHHYKKDQREYRYCHVRDILQQVETHCGYNGLPGLITTDMVDLATESYFGLLDKK